MLLVCIVLTALLASADAVGIGAGSAWAAFSRLTRFVGHLVVMPDWSYLPDLSKRMLETVEMALVATVIAVGLSLPLGILAARTLSLGRFSFFLGTAMKRNTRIIFTAGNKNIGIGFIVA